MNYAIVLHKNMIILFFFLHQNKIINTNELRQNKFLSKYHTQPRPARKHISNIIIHSILPYNKVYARARMFLLGDKFWNIGTLD